MTNACFLVTEEVVCKESSSVVESFSMVSHSFEIPQGESIPEFLEKPHPLTVPVGKWHPDNHLATNKTEILSQDQIFLKMIRECQKSSCENGWLSK